MYTNAHLEYTARYTDSHTGEQTSIHYDDKAIEALLDRSQEEEAEGEGREDKHNKNHLVKEYPSLFKVSVCRVKTVILS